MLQLPKAGTAMCATTGVTEFGAGGTKFICARTAKVQSSMRIAIPTRLGGITKLIEYITRPARIASIRAWAHRERLYVVIRPAHSRHTRKVETGRPAAQLE